jgi:hypothetical protein
MSEDPKGFDAGDYNLFRYCHNDPEDLTDPMGLADLTPAVYKAVDDMLRNNDQWRKLSDSQRHEMVKEILERNNQNAGKDAVDPGKRKGPDKGSDPLHPRMGETRRDQYSHGPHDSTTTSPKQGSIDRTEDPGPPNGYSWKERVGISHDHRNSSNDDVTGRYHNTGDTKAANDTANGGAIPRISTIAHQSDRGRVKETFVPSANLQQRASNQGGSYFYSNDGVHFRDEP